MSKRYDGHKERASRNKCLFVSPPIPAHREDCGHSFLAQTPRQKKRCGRLPKGPRRRPTGTQCLPQSMQKTRRMRPVHGNGKRSFQPKKLAATSASNLPHRRQSRPFFFFFSQPTLKPFPRVPFGVTDSFRSSSDSKDQEKNTQRAIEKARKIRSLLFFCGKRVKKAREKKRPRFAWRPCSPAPDPHTFYVLPVYRCLGAW